MIDDTDTKLAVRWLRPLCRIYRTKYGPLIREDFNTTWAVGVNWYCGPLFLNSGMVYGNGRRYVHAMVGSLTICEVSWGGGR